ncbi:MAG: hypothetical protein R2932_21060 [Caldilineaceae bacterium]
MGAYIRRRLLQSVVVVWGVSVLVFFLLRLAPGDPVTLLLVESASPEQIAEARKVGIGQTDPGAVRGLSGAGVAWGSGQFTLLSAAGH